MDPYIILTDVTCDLSPAIREQFGITDYIHGHVSISDGRELVTTLDWSNITREDFYNCLGDRRMQVSTAPASPEEYYEHFKKYAEAGTDIISISISSKISSTYNVAVGAAERVRAEYPERRIICVDALRMSGSMGLLVMYALEMQKQGKTMAEVIDWLESNKMRVHQMGPIDDLIFVARRGRISMGKAIMGSFAGVKPMGDCNRDGYVTVLTKAKGMKKALTATAAYVKEVATDVEDQYLLIVHSNREAYAETLREKLEAELHPKGIFVSDSYSASGTNIGPGMVAVYFMGDEVTEELTREKEIMTRVMESVR
jgi:DegV family protein with EDD domain